LYQEADEFETKIQKLTNRGSGSDTSTVATPVANVATREQSIIYKLDLKW
jgi:hypothetical protein